MEVRYEAIGDGNPYAPHNIRQAAEPRAVLPEGRLRRLALPDPAIAIYRCWWDGLDDAKQAEAVKALALLPDDDLAAQALTLETLADRPAADVEAWARRQPNRALAAALAETAEQSRAAPRAGVLRKLGRIR